MEKIEAVIRKVGSQYCIFTKDGSKKLGCYKTREQALKRLRQIEFFKHQKGSIGHAAEFIAEYGNDFEPADFAEKSLAEYVKDIRKKKKDMAKKKMHKAECASTTVQSVIVKKSCAKTRAEAKKKAKGFSTKTSRETGDSWRFRQRPPSDFDSKSFRIKKVNDCISLVIGKLKGAK